MRCVLTSCRANGEAHFWAYDCPDYARCLTCDASIEVEDLLPGEAAQLFAVECALNFKTGTEHRWEDFAGWSRGAWKVFAPRHPQVAKHEQIFLGALERARAAVLA